MRIVDNVLRNYTFKELGVGATFKFENGYFIKTNAFSAAGAEGNAIELVSGEFAYMELNDIVHPFQCEVIVM